MGEGVGPDALRLMARRWVIDQAWSWDHGPRGFVWLGQRLPQRFAVEEAGDRLRLIASTTVVEGVDDGARARRALRGYNLLGKGSMWLHDAEHGTIALHCGIELDPGQLEARTHDLSTFALIQLYTGEILAEVLAEAAGGRPAHRPHPTSGVREEADEILTMVDQALVPIGMGPSQFADPDEMAAAAAAVDGSVLTLSPHEDGLVVEASATVEGLSVELRLDPWVGDPDLGSGLRATVRLDAAPKEAAEAWAWELNAAERAGLFEGPLYGAWEPYEGDGGSGVIHTWFTPNALSTVGRARDTMEVGLRRALWAAGRSAGRVERPADPVRPETPPRGYVGE
jgi:hypothetical protein